MTPKIGEEFQEEFGPLFVNLVWLILGQGGRDLKSSLVMGIAVRWKVGGLDAPTVIVSH